MMPSKQPSFLISPEGINRLNDAKARLGLSFTAIAKQAGVGISTVKRLWHPEREQRVGISSIEAILKILNLHLEEIILLDEAQDDDDGFVEAQRRIQEVLLSGDTILYLSDLRLKSLPPELGQLINLITLDLGSNELTALPPELGQLTNLTTLFLGSNELTTLPPELGQLSNLTTLFLHENQLSHLAKIS